MSVKEIYLKAVKGIRSYKQQIDNHKSSERYGADIVSTYNNIGLIIEELTDELDRVFSSDKLCDAFFSDDELQDFLSDNLTELFNEYEEFKKKKKCEEKVALAYEWLFQVMLLTTDDEDIKSRITLNANDITLFINKKSPVKAGDIQVGNRVKIRIKSDGSTEELFVIVDETIDNYIYAYLGDHQQESDLIIFPADRVFQVLR